MITLVLDNRASSQDSLRVLGVQGEAVSEELKRLMVFSNSNVEQANGRQDLRIVHVEL